ncbi:sensor histidine kinase [Marispirochaeta sp.]|jgi:two-component system, sensor histidine kinase YesM|uniref:cache domain-containing sensor histidine kinase n=1 Tax=Marispirochaeta sp. TaxID=2038653 RepID=UPI0029C79F71|nr:sensor histidine kinase [Marispirochaeta sp.]
MSTKGSASPLSIGSRYIRFFLFLLVMPVFFFGFLLDLRYSSRLRQAAIVQLQDLTDQIAASLNEEYKRIQILAAALINNNQFLEACRSYAHAVNNKEIYLLHQEIDDHVSAFFNYTNKMGTVYLVFPDQGLYYYQNYPTLHPVTNLNPEIYRSAVEKKGLNCTLSRLIGANPIEPQQPMFTIAVSPMEYSLPLGLEALIVSFRVRVMDEIANGQGPAARACMALVDDKSDIILSSPLTRAHHPLETYLTEQLAPSTGALVGIEKGSSYLVTSAEIPSTGWRLYRAEDYKNFIEPLRRSRRATYLFFGLMSLGFIFYTRLFFKDLINPVAHVIEKMRIVETGDYSVQVPVEGPREIAALGTSFNRMITEVKRLTAETRAKEREKNQYEMEALQYQIHPHFLANTLNSIRLMADAEGSHHICKMSASLMRLVNESFNRGGQLISLEDEVSSLESYVHIMQIRFGELINICYDIPQELKSIQILKMLLQPIIENAILHGIRESENQGRIDLRVRVKNDQLKISIRDNGIGADEETLKGFLTKSAASSNSGFSGIGLYNIYRRIQLNYGTKYGMDIRSRPGEGTEVFLILPIKADAP